jgi:ACS family tartrate transporter-like MFS transporter
MPMVVLMHVIAYADRVNITFAETEITNDLGISATVFGLAAGAFFLSYVPLEIPSNLMLHRYGARVWLGRIMISWGIVATLTAFVWDGASLVVARILLGVGEAGFFPGVVYLLACWFPEREQGRAMSVFLLGIVIASIGGPIAGALLELDGVLGLEGWQWLFIGQGLPAVAVGFWVLRALPGSPAEADWLPPAERDALERELASESAVREARQTFTLRDALTDRRVLRCGVVAFTINFASYGAIFWAADIIERVGDVEGIELGLLVGIPMALGSTGLIVIGRLSDRSRDRRRWVVIGMLLGAAGLAGTALLPAEAGVLTLGVCAFGLLGAVPALWAIPMSLLTGRAMAGGLALIGTIGVSGGIFGPVAVGVAKDAGSLEAGLGVLAFVLLVGAGLALRLPFTAGRPLVEPSAA